MLFKQRSRGAPSSSTPGLTLSGPDSRRGCELLEGLSRLSEDVLEVIVRRADLNYRLKPRHLIVWSSAL